MYINTYEACLYQKRQEEAVVRLVVAISERCKSKICDQFFIGEKTKDKSSANLTVYFEGKNPSCNGIFKSSYTTASNNKVTTLHYTENTKNK